MKGRKFQQIKLGYHQQIEESSSQASQTIGVDIPNGAAQAELLRAEQLSLQRNAELAFHAQAKAQQIDSLQASLQSAIHSQAAKLAAIEQERPGWPASKQARTAWQNQVTQAKARLAQLERRSERVGEIAQDAGLYADSMLDELAARKLRFHHPDLARQWDTLQQTATQSRSREASIHPKRRTRLGPNSLFEFLLRALIPEPLGKTPEDGVAPSSRSFSRSSHYSFLSLSSRWPITLKVPMTPNGSNFASDKLKLPEIRFLTPEEDQQLTDLAEDIAQQMLGPDRKERQEQRRAALSEKSVQQ